MTIQRKSVLALVLVAVSPTWARVDAQRALRGLDAVGVAVGTLPPDAERRGLSQTALQAEVVHKLRQAGLQVLSDNQWQETVGKPLLHLEVNLLPVESFPVYSATVSLQLRQHACLERNLMVCDAVISWESTSPPRAVSVVRLQTLRKEISDMVDRFVAAYLEENRK